MAVAPECAGANYRCPRCGHRSTLAASFDHDKTTCVERDWQAEEGFIDYRELQVGDVLNGGAVVAAPAEVSRSGKTLSLRITFDGVERVWTRITVGSAVVVPARATGVAA